MSTPMVSAFYDVGDVLFQNQKNNMLKAQYNAERRMAAANIVTNVPPPARNRNFSTGSFVSVSMSNQMQVGGSSMGNASQNMISPKDSAQLSVVAREHRKLDRSMSEPCDRMNNNRTVSQSCRGESVDGQKVGANINSSRYKTELCRPFEETGHCKYGDKCQFAHGGHELRNLSRHPKYKTELCRTYHTIGFCPYGPRCHFIHNEEERKLAGTVPPPSNKNIHQMPTQYAHPPPPVSAAGTTAQRPSSISFNSSCNGSLGSNGESISTSSSLDGDSPTMSPVFGDELNFHHNMLNRHNPRLSPSQFTSSSAGSSTSSSPVFNFPSAEYSSNCITNIANLMAPLNVQTGLGTTGFSKADLGNLEQQINTILNLNLNVTINQRNNNLNHGVFGDLDESPAPPSPPDSISGDSNSSGSSRYSACGSPLEVGKALRLPIFNQLSQD